MLSVIKVAADHGIHSINADLVGSTY